MIDQPVGPPRDGDDGMGRRHDRLKGRATIDFLKVLAVLAKKYGPLEVTNDDLSNAKGAVKREVLPDGTLRYWYEEKL